MAYKKVKLWFDEELAVLLADKILPIYADFDKKSFSKKIKKGVPPLELKARVELIADELHHHLFSEYEKSIDVLLQIFGPENENETGMFTEFYWLMPVAKFIEKYGMDHFEKSMFAIEEVTKRHTGEYTIRPFIEKYPKKALKVIKRWSKSKNRHIRRLASEGIRPKLPWASKLQMFVEDPSPIFPILENLKDDASKYVQKSVANNLNDILKDNYDQGMTIIRNWSNNQPTAHRKWIIKHALRVQIKKNNAEAKSILEQLQ